MSDHTDVVETTVVPVVDLSLLVTIEAQEAEFTKQLDQVKVNMTKYQQEFEVLKIRGTKLEGAIESLQILKKSLQQPK